MMRTCAIGMRACAVVGALVFSAALAPGGKGAPDETGCGWTVLRLDLDVRLLPEERRARFDALARVRLDGADSSMGPAFGVNFQNTLMTFTRMEGPTGSAATLNEPLMIARNMKLAQLRLGEAAERGAEIDVSFSYESDGRAFQYVVAREGAAASWVASWCPVALPGAGSGMSPALLAYPGTTRFIGPSGWSAVSNGRLVEHSSDGDEAVTVWEVETPVARSFAAGPYTSASHTVNGREIGVYLLGPKPKGAESQARLLAAALAAQEARFGEYPYPSYAIAEVPEGLVEWYASSEQGFIMARSSAFEAEHGNLPLWAHEMAHGWWGNLVNATGTGTKWVSESLAQYSAVVAIEAIEGEAAATEFLEYSRSGYNPIQSAIGYFAMMRDGHDMALSAMEGKNGWEHNLSDAKGHWVYHMLRGRIGDEAFFGALRAVIAEFAGKQVSMGAMRHAFIAAAPEATLEAFFAQWLDRPGAPVIDCDWWSVERGAAVHVRLVQRQEGDVYALPLEIEVELKGGERKVFVAEMGEREQEFRFETGARPVAVRMDPERKVLMWRPQYGERPGEGDRAQET